MSFINQMLLFVENKWHVYELDAMVALESHIDRFTVCKFSLNKRELFYRSQKKNFVMTG